MGRTPDRISERETANAATIASRQFTAGETVSMYAEAVAAGASFAVIGRVMGAIVGLAVGGPAGLAIGAWGGTTLGAMFGLMYGGIIAHR